MPVFKKGEKSQAANYIVEPIHPDNWGARSDIVIKSVHEMNQDRYHAYIVSAPVSR